MGCCRRGPMGLPGDPGDPGATGPAGATGPGASTVAPDALVEALISDEAAVQGNVAIITGNNSYGMADLPDPTATTPSTPMESLPQFLGAEIDAAAPTTIGHVVTHGVALLNAIGTFGDTLAYNLLPPNAFTVSGFWPDTTAIGPPFDPISGQPAYLVEPSQISPTPGTAVTAWPPIGDWITRVGVFESGFVGLTGQANVKLSGPQMSSMGYEYSQKVDISTLDQAIPIFFRTQDWPLANVGIGMVFLVEISALLVGASSTPTAPSNLATGFRGKFVIGAAQDTTGTVAGVFGSVPDAGIGSFEAWPVDTFDFFFANVNVTPGPGGGFQLVLGINSGYDGPRFGSVMVRVTARPWPPTALIPGIGG